MLKTVVSQLTMTTGGPPLHVLATVVVSVAVSHVLVTVCWTVNAPRHPCGKPAAGSTHMGVRDDAVANGIVTVQTTCGTTLSTVELVTVLCVDNVVTVCTLTSGWIAEMRCVNVDGTAGNAVDVVVAVVVAVVAVVTGVCAYNLAVRNRTNDGVGTRSYGEA